MRCSRSTIVFKDLGLVVIDEQHRFGVHQRLALQAKGTGSGAELLVMTATPIPRTLLLTSYGDMDVSRLDEKPPGRKPIATRTVPLERLDEVVSGIERAVQARRAGLLGLPAGRRVRGARSRRGGRALRRASRNSSAIASGWSMAGSPARTRIASWRRSPRARCRSWCPPPSSRSASTCRTRRS